VSADPRLIDVAAAVGDGAIVDWSRVADESDARSAAVIRQLRLVERIAAIHASPSPAPETQRPTSTAAHADGPEDELAPGSAWGPLQVAERIGRGTHGDVFAARDVRLDRPVALKLLHAGPASDTADAGVVQEARLLARVRHPNVVAVYGAERVGGRVGIWMELVEGRTLEQELGERGCFAADELVSIGTALCGAVSAVHAAGLLHRDIKAHNVMRGGDGRILLADFGTSHDVNRDGSVNDLAGTPLYLAPEVLGGAAASAASDVYSLGVLLYHLATAAYPVSGRSVADLRDAFLADRRVPLRERRRDVPPAVAGVIERALEPVPSRRYPSAAAFGAALVASTRVRWGALHLAAAAAVLALAAGLGLSWSTGTGNTTPRFVLVGAFVNETGDRRLDDAVEFAFARELMQSRAVSVVPPERIADSLRLMRRPPSQSLDPGTAREVALRDGTIDLIASGRIDRLRARYVLSVVIDHASGGAPVVQASVEVADVDSLLDGVRSLAAKIRAAMGDDRGRVASDLQLARVTTSSLDALGDYSAGLALVDQRRWAAAELRLTDAVRRDPGFASALIMLAHCQRNQARGASAWMPVAEQALQLAAGLPARERYFIEGSYYQMKEDLPRAIAAYEALIDEQPNDFWGHNNLTGAYAVSGRFRDEIRLRERLVQLRPHDPSLLVNLAMRLLMNGERMADAVALATRAANLERPPGLDGASMDAWFELLPAFAAWADGRVADAAALLDRASAGAPPSEWHAYARAQMNLTLGRVAAAEHAFQRMPDAAERDMLLGYAALARGDVAGARARLARAVPAWAQTLRTKGPERVLMPCWALLRTGLADQCRQAVEPWLGDPPAWRWLASELQAGGAVADDEAALRALQGVVATRPPGDYQHVLAVDGIARQLERRGDIPGAVDILRRLDGLHRTVYPQNGVHGFTWLMTRTHLLDIERRRGRTEQVAALVQELEGWVAVADPDFVVRSALR